MSGKVKLYGVLAGKDHGVITTDDAGTEVYSIPYRDICCAVSDSNGMAAGDKKSVLKSLLSYQVVMERIIRKNTIVPIKFGAELGKNDVAMVLEKGYTEFAQRLSALEGKFELDVSASWEDMEGVIREIASENGEVRRLVSAACADTGERLRLGEAIKDAVERKRQEAFEKAHGRLAEYAADSGKNEIAGDKEVFSCAFLVDREKEGTFSSALEALAGDLKGMRLKCISPLPPYAFATFEVKKIRREEITKAMEVLGLGGEATYGEIKAAYIANTLEFHPDRDPENPSLEKAFARIKEAFSILSRCCGKETGIYAGGAEDFFYVERIRV
ncbi:MAG: GvpL/GvpF family gas vesicle protein [Deltaproteobacteria bacterium]|nr:GvpL/GvpF family gas vesicle protein [Deltaproteobacteria bacterium]